MQPRPDIWCWWGHISEVAFSFLQPFFIIGALETVGVFLDALKK